MRSESRDTGIVGTVVSGRGRMTQKMQRGKITRSLLDDATGETLIPGTLNVLVETPIAAPGNAVQLWRGEIAGDREDTIYLAPARVGGLEAWMVRHRRVEQGAAEGRRVLEFVSVHHLRAVLGLSDGDLVTVDLGGRAGFTRTANLGAPSVNVDGALQVAAELEDERFDSKS